MKAARETREKALFLFVPHVRSLRRSRPADTMECMADPYKGSLVKELKRDQMHSQDIAGALEFLRSALGREKIPFGLIGALALRHHGYSRFTEDIDILTTPEGLQRLHEKLIGRGLMPRAEGLKKRLRQTQFKVNVDVLTSGEHAGSDESPTVYPDPLSDAFTEREGIRVATLEKLIEFKIASGVWGHRAQDQGDVQKLIQANALTESFADTLPEELRARFLEILVESRLERDIEE